MPTRAIAALATAALTLSLVVASATSVLAANPDWRVGYGTDSSLPAAQQPSSGASTTSVSAGANVGFFVWLRNADTSNISKLFVNATTSPAATLVGATWTIKNPAGTEVRAGTCPSATPLTCSFGALNAGNTVYIVAAFTTSSTLTDGSIQAADFLFNTTGTPPGKNNSHGDAKPLHDQVPISKNGDASGDFNFDQPSLTVADDQRITSQNKQATSVTVNAGLVGAAVGDSPSLQTICDPGLLPAPVPAFFSCSLLTSLTSVVEVGNGKILNNQNGPGTPGIKVIVSFAKKPGQLTGANPFAYHYWVDATGVAHAELVTAPCTFTGAFPNFPNNTTPCLVVGAKQVTVWLLHNGPMRF